ncbi:MAG: rhodanese-related sulfurtransferase [Candidatus Pacebacteria bacterium]|nr:rhodanese-related sulfurtransferase [Candidatus Paceibacterota bacterium]MCF7857291.1 rhodanese-related sulfurtransferase [Candidatus Paceibacterota bacterium]
MKPKAIPRKERKEMVMHEHIPRTTFSFYKYVRISDPQAMRNELFETLSQMGCLGRIYVASEGINAQMNVPTENFKKFDEYLQGKKEFSGIPYKIAVEETEVVSFYMLTIKVKTKIVADGLDDDTFDVTKTGEYLTAEEMNEYIEDPDAVIVDMRNGYESEVGHFEGAITPDVDTFREELKITPEILSEHKEKKIALYCTGGIRCEKASAWLKHNGFKDVKHLKGGIIDYKRQVDEKDLANKFKGKNFVFDERMGERITDEIISLCHLCGKEKCDEHIHCKNQACHVLFICCDSCKSQKKGFCSYRCMVFDVLPEIVKRRLIKNNHKKKLEQFKKHRLKSISR